MGRKLVLTGTKLTNLAAPKLLMIDPIESPGSMMLVEPMHPFAKWAAGVPENNGGIANLFSANAQTVAGKGTNFNAEYDTSGMSGPKGLVERSAKGGLHAIYSNTNADNIATGSSCYAQISPIGDLLVYLGEKYATNNYFMSLWTNVTRLAPGVGQDNVEAVIGSRISTSGNFKLMSSVSGISSNSSDNRRVTGKKGAGGVTGPHIRNLSRLGYSVLSAPNDAIPNGSNSNLMYVFQVGNRGTMNSYLTAKGNVPSQVFYRSYIEDLTVSGRSYEEVDAIDNALYAKEVLTPGGRYYGDTFTDPSTIP